MLRVCPAGSAGRSRCHSGTSRVPSACPSWSPSPSVLPPWSDGVPPAGPAPSGGACSIFPPGQLGMVAPNLAQEDHIKGRPLILIAVLASRSEEHTSELQSLRHLVCRLLLEKKNK